ncbi:hypothetical protein SCOCK_30201 [Actinacidiphila cocklensis]|uniref:Uncharacterized protein n=1 Tax=Actinacidiphila cocklensis TaxID=887465 RepID=A0A9W4GTS8_9ACTN|nr:hypothetical protein SCOCK_30201 [Actinacidiphila cocklensis]
MCRRTRTETPPRDGPRQPLNRPRPPAGLPLRPVRPRLAVPPLLQRPALGAGHGAGHRPGGRAPADRGGPDRQLHLRDAPVAPAAQHPGQPPADVRPRRGHPAARGGPAQPDAHTLHRHRRAAAAVRRDGPRGPRVGGRDALRELRHHVQAERTAPGPGHDGPALRRIPGVPGRLGRWRRPSAAHAAGLLAVLRPDGERGAGGHRGAADHPLPALRPPARAAAARRDAHGVGGRARARRTRHRHDHGGVAARALPPAGRPARDPRRPDADAQRLRRRGPGPLPAGEPAADRLPHRPARAVPGQRRPPAHRAARPDETGRGAGPAGRTGPGAAHPGRGRRTPAQRGGVLHRSPRPDRRRLRRLARSRRHGTGDLLPPRPRRARRDPHLLRVRRLVAGVADGPGHRRRRAHQQRRVRGRGPLPGRPRADPGRRGALRRHRRERRPVHRRGRIPRPVQDRLPPQRPRRGSPLLPQRLRRRLPVLHVGPPPLHRLRPPADRHLRAVSQSPAGARRQLATLHARVLTLTSDPNNKIKTTC